MNALVLSAVLAASPTVGVFVSSELGKPEATPAATYLQAIEAELTTAKLEVVRLTSTCKGDRACELKLGADAKVAAIVPVTISWAKKRTTIDVEAVRLKDGVSIGQLTFSVSGKLGKPQDGQIATFATNVSAGLPRVDDTPRVEPRVEVSQPLTPTTPPKETPGLTAPAPATKSSKVPAVIVGGVAIGSGVASGVLLGLAAGARGQVNGLTDPAPVPPPQAQALVDQANGQYTASLALGITAAAAATVAIILLAAE